MDIYGDVLFEKMAIQKEIKENILFRNLKLKDEDKLGKIKNNQLD